MTDPIRAALEQLVAADEFIGEAGPEYQQARDAARAALDAAPEGEGPTDEEWDALVDRVWDKYQTVGYQGERFMYNSDFGNALDLVRKELAHSVCPATLAAPAAPLKERPDFMAGYREGLADGRRIVEHEDAARAALEQLVETIEGIELEGLPEVDEALAAARTALANPDGPAVSDGKGSVLTFENIMQIAYDYFNFRGNSHGDSFFATSIEAKKDPAQSLYEFARAVLAEPELEGPTDDEPPPGPLSEHDLRQQWNQQADEFNQWDSLDSSEQLAWAQVRAIAADRARWGRPAPAPAGEGLKPVPVGDPPKPEDCDAEGRCWWFVPTSVLPNGICPYWCLAPAESPRSWFTHWLPARALPIP